ncbi:hypothetical protein MOQ_001846 [Trypanosoma cruzi marinkellei]|uniref:Uncharacterized protein n=1 Tax=Trypanosoma cruzi marinkellei TaxID=85056 RepID=K2NJL0_TRYCR|nr:hypothetical protein MOQ_001846 [Trypanosoma cruzi marinkellei]
MPTNAEYASMMELDEVLIERFLAGFQGETEDQLNSLLELKSLVEPLDPKVAQGVVFRNSGNCSATIECLRKLGEKHSLKTEIIGHGESPRDKNKERSFFSWLFKRKPKREVEKSSPERGSSKADDDGTPSSSKVKENAPFFVSSHEIREKPLSQEKENNVSHEKEQNVPQEEEQNFDHFTITRPVINRSHEEEELSKEYNFYGKSNTNFVSVSDHVDEFQKIFSKFLESVS